MGGAKIFFLINTKETRGRGHKYAEKSPLLLVCKNIKINMYKEFKCLWIYEKNETIIQIYIWSSMNSKLQIKSNSNVC